MMKLNKYSISAVIIARNEESTVGKVIEESIEILPKLTNKYEILVNDDASSDRTGKILNSYAKKYSYIKVYHQKKALGISGGFEFLYKKAKFNLIFINAADGQYTIKDLPNLVAKINEGYDLVIGKRKFRIQYNIFRKIVSFTYSLLPKILFGFELYDPGSNKLYKKKVIRDTKPSSKSVFSEAERIIRAYKLGYKVTSVSIRHFAREKGSSSATKPQIILHSIFDILKLFFSLQKRSLFIILSLIILIIIGQIFSITPVIDRALNGDDWDTLTVYKSDPKTFYFERVTHIYTTFTRAYISQHIYIGTLFEIFGVNFQIYQLVNILLKIIASISIYPLILILFKNRFLAFLTTFLFSIWPSAAGGLTFITTGQHYLAIIFINLFIISYYYLLKNQIQHKKIHFSALLISSLLFYFSIISAPERIFPFFLVPFFVDLTFTLKIIFNRNSNISFKTNYLSISLRRFLLIYGLVYLLFFKLTPADSPDFYHSILFYYNEIFNHSNWHILFVPFSALGYTLFDNNILNIFFNSDHTTPLTNNLQLLPQKLIIFASIITFLITWVIKPKSYILFYLSTLLITIFSALLIISIITKNIYSIPIDMRNSQLDHLNTAFIGIFYFILAIAIFIEWFINQRGSKFLLALSLCPLWSLLFIVSTWLTGVDTNINNPIHRYLTIPSLGATLFVSIIITLFYRRLKEIGRYHSKVVPYLILAVLIIPIFYYQTSFIYKYFKNDNEATGRLNSQQDLLKQRLDEKLDKNRTKNILVYVEWDNDLTDKIGFSFFDSAQNLLLYDKNYNLIEGCKGIIYSDISKLKNITRINNGVVTFSLQSYCINRSTRSDQLIEFKIEEFHAYLLKHDNFYDIKEQTLAKLKP